MTSMKAQQPEATSGMGLEQDEAMWDGQGQGLGDRIYVLFYFVAVDRARQDTDPGDKNVGANRQHWQHPKLARGSLCVRGDGREEASDQEP